MEASQQLWARACPFSRTRECQSPPGLPKITPQIEPAWIDLHFYNPFPSFFFFSLDVGPSCHPSTDVRAALVQMGREKQPLPRPPQKRGIFCRPRRCCSSRTNLIPRSGAAADVTSDEAEQISWQAQRVHTSELRLLWVFLETGDMCVCIRIQLQAKHRRPCVGGAGGTVSLGHVGGYFFPPLKS